MTQYKGGNHERTHPTDCCNGYHVRFGLLFPFRKGCPACPTDDDNPADDHSLYRSDDPDHDDDDDIHHAGTVTAGRSNASKETEGRCPSDEICCA